MCIRTAMDRLCCARRNFDLPNPDLPNIKNHRIPSLMDSFEFNKIAGAVLASLLVILGVGMFLGPALYAPTEPAQQAYVVEGLEADTGDGAVAEAPVEQPIEALIAAATVERGERVARRCVACHSFDEGGANGIGPNLWNIMGDKMAHLDNFNYSSALAGFGGEWNWETMNAFLLKPSEYIPGTIMSFAGLNKAEDRAAVMAYLAAQAPTPYPKPALPDLAADSPAPVTPDTTTTPDAPPSMLPPQAGPQ